MAAGRRWSVTIAGTVAGGCAALLALVGPAVAVPPGATRAGGAGAAVAPNPAAVLAAGETALVTVQLPTEAMLHELVASGADIANRPRHRDGRVLVDLVITGAQLADLVAPGARPVRVVQRAGEGSRPVRRQRAGRAGTHPGRTAPPHRSGRGPADRRGRRGHPALPAGVLVDERRPDLPADPGRDHRHRRPGRRDHRHLAHRRRRAPARTRWSGSRTPASTSTTSRCRSRCRPQPVQLTATSSLGGVSRPVTPQAWPGATPPPLPTGYQKDFIDAYLTPVDIQARIKRLARQYPTLVDVIDLPNRTQGYRRTAVALPRRPGRRRRGRRVGAVRRPGHERRPGAHRRPRPAEPAAVRHATATGC